MWTVPCKTTVGPPPLASPAMLGVSVQLKTEKSAFPPKSNLKGRP